MTIYTRQLRWSFTSFKKSRHFDGRTATMLVAQLLVPTFVIAMLSWILMPAILFPAYVSVECEKRLHVK